MAENAGSLGDPPGVTEPAGEARSAHLVRSRLGAAGGSAISPVEANFSLGFPGAAPGEGLGRFPRGGVQRCWECLS